VSPEDAVADAHRREWAVVLASTVRVTRDLDLAEECVQDAYAAALRDWARDGVPARPGAWLTTAARHNALDLLRRAKTLRGKLHLLVEPLEHEDTEVEQADPLRLIFLCCHPALAPAAQVALTLRLVCGVATPDVASAFLVSESTMAARLTRAKKKIVAARIPFRLPTAAQLPDRLDAALTVVHLLFSTGHTAPSGAELTRTDLMARAVELARLLVDRMPDEAEARGLLALLVASHARRATRVAADGRLLLLSEQDRSAWDRSAIMAADELVVGALRMGRPGRFVLEAAIATLHAVAPSYEDTDWPQILVLYTELLAVWPSPVVALNRAVAMGMVDGPAAALAEVEALDADGRLAGYRYLFAVKADLLRQLDQDARPAYEQALALTDNAAERAFLERRLAEITAGSPRGPSGRPC
jgi:RNA polymerase sigma-70 factor, ECF subfamily